MKARPITVPELATRALLRPANCDWLALILPLGAMTSIFQALLLDIESLDAMPAVIESPPGPRSLVKQLATTHESIIVVLGLEHFTESDWKALDSMRSLLIRQQSIVLLLSQRSAEQMATNAPNLSSWMTGAVFELVNTDQNKLSESERDDKLAALRAATGLSDAEVIRLATSHTLSPEPEFAEWLVLLGRKDLIEH